MCEKSIDIQIGSLMNSWVRPLLMKLPTTLSLAVLAGVSIVTPALAVVNID